MKNKTVKPVVYVPASSTPGVEIGLTGGSENG